MDQWIAGSIGVSVDRWIVRSLERWIGGSGDRWITGSLDGSVDQ